MIGGAERRLAIRLAGGLLLSLLTGIGCANTGKVDPWEKLNRGTFAFNEAADQYAIQPVARVWNFALPEFAQTGIRNVYDNLNMPVVFANDLLQGKPGATTDDLIRVLVNSTFGLGGLVDVATFSDVAKNDENFGQTFGVWGIAKGPYLVLPILGPSTTRSAVGLAADTAATPHTYFFPFWINATSTSLRLLNLRAYYLEEVDQNRLDAFDYYIFMRDAFLQNLDAKVGDSSTDDLDYIDDEDDLYYFEDEE